MKNPIATGSAAAALLLFAWVVAAPVFAADPDLDALERRLQKAEKSKQEAAPDEPKKKPAAVAEEKKSEAPPPPPASTVGRTSGGMKDLGGGVLEQVSTGLEWTKSDNGRDLDWDAAVTYCRDLPLSGGGWSLPDENTLASLYDPSFAGRPCASGAEKKSCRVSGLFDLSSFIFWSSTRKGSQYVYVFFDDGSRFTFSGSKKAQKRALCARKY